MTNALTTTKILPPDAFGDDGDNLGGVDLLLFDGKRGLWTSARDKAEVPGGTKAVAFVDQLLKGFVRFDDGVPRQRLLPLWPAPDLQALRQSLGDLDQKLWPDRTAKGTPQDPWRPARQLPVIILDATLDCLVYSTSSLGGVIAISQLCRAVQAERRDPENADALPVVTLAADSYPHPNKQFGKIFTPLLDIARWTTLGAVKAAMDSGDLAKLGVAVDSDDAEPERPRKVAAKRPRR